jgi:hypothetical protein
MGKVPQQCVETRSVNRRRSPQEDYEPKAHTLLPGRVMGAATITAKSVLKAVPVPPRLDQTNWHALEPHDVTLLLKVDPKVGLTPS